MASNFEIINLDCAVYGYSDGQDFVEKPCVLRCGHASCKNCIPTDKVIIFKICNIKNEIDLAKMKEQDSFKIKTLISIHFKELFKTLKSCYDCSLNSKMISFHTWLRCRNEQMFWLNFRSITCIVKNIKN